LFTKIISNGFAGKAEPATINSDPKGPEYDRFTLEWNARSLSPITRYPFREALFPAKSFYYVPTDKML
jgi:hypothetical protein